MGIDSCHMQISIICFKSGCVLHVKDIGKMLRSLARKRRFNRRQVDYE
jgi:hypothetical protein